ncbi:MAG: hypothetical protein RIG68_03010 [Imperialibacter sp.]|uniref:hypothetical protein n=1 Tax=Imperialibacter sp. TaxID=2038411 RepID=UPI0032ED5145
MWIKKVEVGVDESSIDPRFLFRAEFEYVVDKEIPLFISGFLKTPDGRKLAAIDSEQELSGYDNIVIPISEGNSSSSGNERSVYSRKFSATISKKAIDFLEHQRLSRSTKSVLLKVELEIATLYLDTFSGKALKIERQPGNMEIEIEQSSWLRNFSEKLGLGEFLIIEFSKHHIQLGADLKSMWTEKLDRALTRLGEMHTLLNEGKWDKVFETSRKVWDIFKLYKEDHDSKEELKKLFEKNNYSELGFEDLLKSIWHLHEFSSKFIHDKGKKGQDLNPIPVPQKEDAYFMYMWTMGFVNLINEKVKGIVAE